MLPRLLASAVLSIALMQGAAFAQSKSTASGSSQQSAANQNAQSLPQELKQKLQNQGFTDVRVVPGSYIVSAKDKDGDPITAIIGPHSMTIFSMQTASGTTGSSSSDMSKPGGSSSKK